LTLTESARAALPVSTAFTFQGQLKDGGTPADGIYDLQFRLYDSLSGGAQIGTLLTKVGVVVDHGLFTLSLDFGPLAFAGQQRWLEVAARSSGAHGAPFTVLSPRQAVTASPYALYALAGPGSGGYWAGSGADIYSTNGGNVGIGTDAPADELHVSGTNPTLRVQDDSDPGSYTVLQDDGSTDTAQLEKRVSYGVPTVEISPMPIDTVSDARIRFFRRTNTSGAKVVLFNRGRNSDSVSALIGVDGYDSWFQADGGNFGIGTNAPAHPLHLSSSAQIMEKVSSSHTAGTWLDLENTSTGGKRWGIVSTGSANGEGAGNLLLRAITDGRTVMTLKGTGDVGIGTTSPQAKLHVEGGTKLWAVYGKAGAANGWGAVFSGSGSFGGGQALMVTGDSLLAGSVETGDTTVQGDLSVSGTAGIGYQIVEATSSGDSADALCPAGKKVIGGGCSCGLDFVTNSAPLDGGIGWHCACDSSDLHVHAICAKVE